MARIYFYAAPEDQLNFRQYIDSLSLFVFPHKLRLLGKTPSSRKDQFGGFISYLPSEMLNAYRGYNRPGIRSFVKRHISEVTDPLIWWTQSYLMDFQADRYIIPGTLEWEFNDPNRPDDAKKGKRYFDKLCRWIRKEWPPAAKGARCRGPEAQRLIQFQGVLPRGLPPDINIQYTEVGDGARGRLDLLNDAGDGGFEGRFLSWINRNCRGRPKFDAGWWTLVHRGKSVWFQVVTKDQSIALPKNAEWVLRIQEPEPTPFIETVEKLFAGDERVRRKVQVGGAAEPVIQVQFRSDELLPDKLA